jgi:hypothetical protein
MIRFCRDGVPPSKTFIMRGGGTPSLQNRNTSIFPFKKKQGAFRFPVPNVVVRLVLVF